MVGISTGKPYKIIEENNNYQIREFENFQVNDLYWHRDKEDRIVTLISGDVKIQFENELPIKMETNKIYNIPKMVYHRVISKNYFKVKIEFKKE